MTEMTRRRRLTAEAREQQLLDVAEELFAEHGFEGVSVEDIARSAGITRPIVYQHHGSLEGIFVACVRRARDELNASLLASNTQVHPGLEEAMTAGGRVFFELAEKNPRRWALLFSTSASLGGSMSEQLMALRQQTIERIADIAIPYFPAADRAMLLAAAHVISGIGEQLGRWWMIHPDTSLSDVVAMETAAVVGAVRGLFALQIQPGDPFDKTAEGPGTFASSSTCPSVPAE
jgi:AcrR family transcriptional regulator